MSEIKQHNALSKSIKNPEDVRNLYEGVDYNPNLPDVPKMGIELEFNLFNQENLSPLSVTQSENIVAAAGKVYDLPIHHEPSASTLEILTCPFESNDVLKIIDQIETRFQKFIGICDEHGIFPSPFGTVPHLKPEDHNLIQNERYLAFWVPARNDMQGIFHSFLYPNMQASISYQDWDHLYKIVQLSIALEPVLFLATDASAPFFDGGVSSVCPRFALYNTRGRNGGVPDFYYTAKNGKELMTQHINYTLTNEHVFACFNFDGVLQQLPSGQWPSFLELEKLGLGPQNFLNYRQAQSENWRRTTNIAEIRNESGNVFGHRAELNSLFATGLQHQRITAIVLTYLIGFHDSFYTQTKALLNDFGIDIDHLGRSKNLLVQNYDSATHHNGNFADIHYGTKTMGEFTSAFADIIESALANSDLCAYADPILHILRTARPDWLVHREQFETLDELKSFLSQISKDSEMRKEYLSARSCADFFFYS